MAFASDKNAYGISDRSGFRYRLRDMKKEWTGALVGPDEYEPKHPQLYPPKVGPDPQALRNPRPDPESGHVYVPVGNRHSHGGDHMSFTYGQLKQAIQDYTENSETSFVTNLPIFIRSAEERILKTVQLALFRRNQTATLTASNPYLNAPSDYLAPFSLSYTDAGGDKNFVEFKDVNFVQEYAPDVTATAHTALLCAV
jgi:hypothetical protein